MPEKIFASCKNKEKDTEDKLFSKYNLKSTQSIVCLGLLDIAKGKAILHKVHIQSNPYKKQRSLIHTASSVYFFTHRSPTDKKCLKKL
jgi:hypothetical protein